MPDNEIDYTKPPAPRRYVEPDERTPTGSTLSTANALPETHDQAGFEALFRSAEAPGERPLIAINVDSVRALDLWGVTITIDGREHKNVWAAHEAHGWAEVTSHDPAQVEPGTDRIATRVERGLVRIHGLTPEQRAEHERRFPAAGLEEGVE